MRRILSLTPEQREEVRRKVAEEVQKKEERERSAEETPEG